jgi:cell division protein FtsQ
MRDDESTARRSTSKKRRRAKRRLSKFAYFLVLLIVALCAAALCGAVFLKVDTITVSGKSSYSSAQIVEASGIKNGTNLLNIDKDGAVLKICEKLPYIADAQVQISPPTTINIVVTENQPKYAIKYAKQFALADENLKALGLSPDTKKYPNVLKIDGAEITNFEDGSQIALKDKTQVESIKALAAAVKEAGIPKITSMNVADSYQLLVVYDNRITIVVGSEVEADKKLKDAAAIIKTKIQQSDKGSLDVSTQNKRYTFSPS